MNALLVLLGEETKPACGAVRTQEPVARLPGAQQFGAHTNASAELANTESWTVGHNWSLTELLPYLYKSYTMNQMTLKAIKGAERRETARAHRCIAADLRCAATRIGRT